MKEDGWTTAVLHEDEDGDRLEIQLHELDPFPVFALADEGTAVYITSPDDLRVVASKLNELAVLWEDGAES